MKRNGGTASSQEVISQLDLKEAKERWISFYRMPPGLTHPVADFVFSLSESGELEAEFVAQKRALVHNGLVDHDADGIPDTSLMAEIWIENNEEPSDLGKEIDYQLAVTGRAGPFRDDGPGPGEVRVAETPTKLFGGGFLDVIERTFLRSDLGLEVEYHVQPYKPD